MLIHMWYSEPKVILCRCDVHMVDSIL